MDVVAFAKVFYKDLRERRDDLIAAIVNGNAKSYDDYRYMVGEAQGLLFAIENLRALLERADDDGADT